MNNEPGVLMRYACSQFGNPRGLIGRLAGKIMANRSSNKIRNLWTLDLLGIEEKDWVLEIEFGPGFAIQHAAQLAKEGFVMGVDRSEEMLRMASKKNSLAIREKRMELRTGSLESLSIEKEIKFHKIYSVNTWMFWSDSERCLRELCGHLHESGRIAITHQPKLIGANEQASRECGEEISSIMKLAGIKNIRMDIKDMEPCPAVCVLGGVNP